MLGSAEIVFSRCSVSFRSSFTCRLLLDLDPYGGNDPDGTFSLFYRQVGRELAPKLAVIARHQVGGIGFRHVGDWPMLPQCQRDLLSRVLEIIGVSLLHLSCQRYLRRLWLRS